MCKYFVQVLFGQHEHITICLSPEKGEARKWTMNQLDQKMKGIGKGLKQMLYMFLIASSQVVL